MLILYKIKGVNIVVRAGTKLCGTSLHRPLVRYFYVDL